jgi:peptidoglycan/xylan/chitin deacetylase (PgdA/CDA1 family)
VYLEDYGLQRMEADIDRSLEYLYSLSGMRARSFAYPCGQTYVGREGRRQSYIPLVASRFMSGRGYPSLEINDPLSCNMEYLQSVKYDGIAIETVRELTGKALSSGGWLIFTGHETPEEFPVLKETIAFLSSQDSLWIDTVGAITEYILGNR